MQEIYSSLNTASALSVQQVAANISPEKSDNEIEIRHKEIRDARAVAGYGQEFLIKKVIKQVHMSL